MVGFREAVVGGIRDAVCEWSNNVDNFWTSVGNLASETIGIPGFLTPNPSTSLIGQFVCDRPMPIPVPPIPFTGGQCPGIQYRVEMDIRLTNINTGNDQVVDRAAIGVGPASWGTVTQPNGNVTIGFNFNGAFNGALTYNPGVEMAEVIAFVPTRLDGMPDDCGDPPPSVNPINVNNNVTNNITYEDNSGNTVNQDIDYTFGFAYVDVNADFNIPVRVDVGGITIPVRFNVSTGDIDRKSTRLNSSH